MGLVNLIDQGVTCRPSAALVGHITSVEKYASVPKDFRPITVLTLPYRTWSTIRARQCVRYLDKIVYPGVKGDRPQQGTVSIWWQVACEIEAAHFQNQPLSGFVTDVCKAFNNLARPIIFARALHFGLPFFYVSKHGIGGLGRSTATVSSKGPPLKPSEVTPGTPKGIQRV